MVKALQKGVLTDSLTAQSTDETLGTAFAVPITSNQLTVFAIANGTVSSGVVTIEEAHDPEYTGTWSSIGTISPTTGAVLAAHIFSSLAAVRVRISTAIGGGGTVTVKLMSN